MAHPDGRGRCRPCATRRDAAARAAEPLRHLYYTPRWRRLARQVIIAAGGVCQCDECTRTGRVLEATDCDHIQPHRGDRRRFWDRTNLQALSHACHARKTGREVQGRRTLG